MICSLTCDDSIMFLASEMVTIGNGLVPTIPRPRMCIWGQDYTDGLSNTGVVRIPLSIDEICCVESVCSNVTANKRKLQCCKRICIKVEIASHLRIRDGCVLKILSMVIVT